jgi:large subunit ribosomal protein LX
VLAIPLPIEALFPLASPVSNMSEYTVSGRFQARDGWQPFESQFEAPNEDVAEERACAELGSRHAVKRTQIEISEVSA